MIQPKLKQCAGCGELKVIWKNFEGNKFCKECWSRKAPVKAPTPTKSLSPVSDKRKVLDQLYSKMRKEFLDQPENSTCRAKLAGVCLHVMGQDLTIHHTKGRGHYYLDKSTWIPLCLACHEAVHNMSAEEAISLGLKSTRY